jgi:hypothetical protein
MLKGLAADGVFVEVTEEAHSNGISFGKCRYFRAPITGAGGKEACALLNELTEEELKSVRVKIGHHKELELVAENIPVRDTNVLHIIVGNGKDPGLEVSPENATVYTWYPGRLATRAGLSRTVVKLG